MTRSAPPALAIFLALIATLFLLAPLYGTARRLVEPSAIESVTRFGPFGFLSVRTVLAEPRYELHADWHAAGLAKTGAAIACVWALVIWRVRSGRNRPQPE